MSKEIDQRTTWEKFQDTSRDIFVFLVILVVFVIPTTYIGIRAFQPMTVPGYEGTTLANFIGHTFAFEINSDSQFMAFLYTAMTPYFAIIDVAKQYFPIKGEQKSMWQELPNAWWASIQEECIHWLQIARS